MVKATDVVCKYNEGEFAVKHKKDGFKADFVGVSIGSTAIYGCIMPFARRVLA